MTNSTKTIINNSSVDDYIAVPLLTDNYDHSDDPYRLSATYLQKPIKEIILAPSVISQEVDVLDSLNSFIGTAIHDAVERVWLDNPTEALKALGYSLDVIDKMHINPPDDYLEMFPDTIPIYIEQRTEKEIDGYTITGKFDAIIDGVVNDIKTTKAYSYIKREQNREKFQLQGSIYRWLNPDKITKDYLIIQYIILDWQAFRVFREKDYPKNPVVSYKIPLLSIQETENYIRKRIQLINQYKGKQEQDLPRCTDKDLWKEPSKWKYYKNKSNTKRATKVYSNYYEALNHLHKDGGTGVILEDKQPANYCNYCSARSVCKQRLEYL